MKELYNDLVNWYDINKRDFPWRKDHNPYHIWISEIMLQQTTTSAVIPYFNKFIQRFPDIQTLASASLDDVYKMWEGLGYYRRAKHIHETSIILSNNYNNQFPQNYNDVLNLKGIGHYSAGAICSIAFNQKVAAIDGNVLRIMSRVLNTNKNIAKTKQSVRAYDKKFNKASKASDAADKKWSEVQEQYKSLGKTNITRAIRAARGTSKAAKSYNKGYEAWEKMQNNADKKWGEAKAEYANTGRNQVERILNNMKYGS